MQAKENNDTLFLMPKTDLVTSKVKEARAYFLDQLNNCHNISTVVLKADQIGTIDSLGVNLIIDLYRHVNSIGKVFKITGAGEKILRIAHFSQFPAFFSINDKEER